ncbi:DAO-domain-containing protein [Aspergillus steynii IBT 23096]|uniref:DAO-domain-containing protein n=1 Tax=Aspergillus steynii IBT 23096 TaxID=1392250 RepID=A0A2I2GFH6_9EURO|nr:DAO-domain-containing protein [Aspergillus steynii IBT 23096]PLB51611.1 DAO-domain-containing protein [Aspergillus steynii IBT 23096]
MPPKNNYDVAIIGGGPIGLSTAHELAKAGHSVVVLEQYNFFNQAGSSGDLQRMFRTTYTEDFMADLAYESMRVWEELEAEAGETLRWMTGLLNFGNPEYHERGPEGTLLGPIENLKRLGMEYTVYTKSDIERSYPFTNLPDDYIGIYAPDNGIINVPLLVRTLYRLAKQNGAQMHSHTQVTRLDPESVGQGWRISAIQEGQPVTYHADKIVLTCGAYINSILRASFGIQLRLEIWEMAGSYYSLFFGYPVLPWGPPDLARITVDTATRRISDPAQRNECGVSEGDIANTRDFVTRFMKGVNPSIPVFESVCLQGNVFDNMFVLDQLPEEYLRGAEPGSVVLFTAGWAMKFVPLVGRALKGLVVDGRSRYARGEFAVTRKDERGEGLNEEV